MLRGTSCLWPAPWSPAPPEGLPQRGPCLPLTGLTSICDPHPLLSSTPALMRLGHSAWGRVDTATDLMSVTTATTAGSAEDLGSLLLWSPHPCVALRIPRASACSELIPTARALTPTGSRAGICLWEARDYPPRAPPVWLIRVSPGQGASVNPEKCAGTQERGQLSSHIQVHLFNPVQSPATESRRDFQFPF